MSISPVDLQNTTTAAVRRDWAVRLLTPVVWSICILVPCFWQAHIETTDLPSHLYNAWLYLQVVSSHISGLTVTHPITNVLADNLFSSTMSFANVWWAEHIVVPLSVLTFFWGAHRFVAAVSGRTAWWLTPLLAMISYGTIFRWGFVNFYFSVGFGLWAASFALDKRRPRWIWAGILWCLAIAAHASGALWAAAIVVYLRASGRGNARQRQWIFGVSAALVVAGRLVLPMFIRCDWPDYSLKHVRLYLTFAGLNQVTPYDRKYFIIAAVLPLLWLPSFLKATKGWSIRDALSKPLLQLLILHVLVSVVAPLSVYLPSYPPGVNLSLLNDRLSLFTALLLCAIAAQVDLTRLQRTSLIAIAGLYFVFAYSDERALNGREAQVLNLVQTLPASSRVISTLQDEDATGVPKFPHILDRPCIGHCFDYANYEPSTAQFRVRATGPNKVVMWNFEDTERVKHGTYVVKREDMPVYQIHLCAKDRERVCADLRSPGEVLRIDPLAVRSFLNNVF